MNSIEWILAQTRPIMIPEAQERGRSRGRRHGGGRAFPRPDGQINNWPITAGSLGLSAFSLVLSERERESARAVDHTSRPCTSMGPGCIFGGKEWWIFFRAIDRWIAPSKTPFIRCTDREGTIGRSNGRFTRKEEAPYEHTLQDLTRKPAVGRSFQDVNSDKACRWWNNA